jgi:frataxin-like iron-binding protein CyaY
MSSQHRKICGHFKNTLNGEQQSRTIILPTLTNELDLEFLKNVMLKYFNSEGVTNLIFEDFSVYIIDPDIPSLVLWLTKEDVFNHLDVFTVVVKKSGKF